MSEIQGWKKEYEEDCIENESLELLKYVNIYNGIWWLLVLAYWMFIGKLDKTWNVLYV